MQLAAGNATGEGLAGACQYRQPREECVVARRVRVTGERVEEKVGQRMPSQVFGPRQRRREDKALRGNATLVRLAAQVVAARGVGVEQPQDATGRLTEQAHPDIEEHGVNLPARVKTREHEAGDGQLALRPRGSLANRSSRVTGQV